MTRIRLADPAVIGTLLFRDRCVTLVDLARRLRDEPPARGPEPTESESPENQLVLIMNSTG